MGNNMKTKKITLFLLILILFTSFIYAQDTKMLKEARYYQK